MKKTSTMNLDLIIARSLYLQELLMKLPDDQLSEVLVSPRYELVQSLKSRLKRAYDRGHEHR